MTGRKQLAVGALVVGITVAVAYGATHYLRHELFPIELGSKAPDFTAYTLDSIPPEHRERPFLRKPHVPERLLAVLEEMVGQGEHRPAANDQGSAAGPRTA